MLMLVKISLRLEEPVRLYSVGIGSRRIKAVAGLEKLSDSKLNIRGGVNVKC